jgi:hypothetical protein
VPLICEAAISVHNESDVLGNRPIARDDQGQANDAPKSTRGVYKMKEKTEIE